MYGESFSTPRYQCCNFPFGVLVPLPRVPSCRRLIVCVRTDLCSSTPFQRCTNVTVTGTSLCFISPLLFSLPCSDLFKHSFPLFFPLFPSQRVSTDCGVDVAPVPCRIPPPVTFFDCPMTLFFYHILPALPVSFLFSFPSLLLCMTRCPAVGSRAHFSFPLPRTFPFYRFVMPSDLLPLGLPTYQPSVSPFFF